MSEKPTYEELEQRVRELEIVESERKQIQESLRSLDEHLSLYRNAVGSMEDYKIAVVGSDYRYRIVSPQYLEIYNLTEAEIVGKTVAEIMGDGVFEHAIKPNLDQALKGQVVHYSDWFEFSNRERYREVSYYPVLDEDKKVVSIVVLSHDMTEKRRAEEALRESEARYQRITAGLTDYIYTVRVENGKAVETTHSPACEAVTGYTAEEFAADPYLWIRMLEEEDRDRVIDHVREVYEGKESRGVEHRIVRKDGRTIWVSYSTVSKFDAHGQLVSYDGITKDITERKRAEEALRESEALLARSQQLAHLGSWKLDIPANRLDWSDEVYRIFGCTPLEFDASYEAFLGFVHPDDRAAVDEAYTRSLRERRDSYEIEHRIVRKATGEVRFVHERCVHECDDAGAVIRSIGMVQDITDRKKAEAEREKLQAQFNQAQKMESVGRLAGGVAHDFNNMLQAILGHTELALGQVDPAQPFFADLQQIKISGERSADLVRQLLAFARKQIISPEVLDLNETVEGTLKMLRRLIGEDIDLAWLPGHGLWNVKVDPSQIDQVLANLAVNARDAIAGVGKVTIETGIVRLDEAYCREHAGFVPGEYVLLAVSDNGAGMGKDVLEHLFEPFFTTKEVGKGTGLGLATVYGIVKQNNGFINVYSEPGHGTTVKIYLPPCDARAEPELKEGGAATAVGGNETILLVEDEPAVLKMTTKMLERLGYLVVHARNPGEAIRLAGEHEGEIHLLVTDVVMPEMNGRDLAGRLTSSYPNLKHLFISGYTANVIAHHGVLEESVHFLQKPFSMKDLAGRVRETLDTE